MGSRVRAGGGRRLWLALGATGGGREGAGQGGRRPTSGVPGSRVKSRAVYLSGSVGHRGLFRSPGEGRGPDTVTSFGPGEIWIREVST